VLRCSLSAAGRWDSGKTIRDVFPETREHRCWWHKIGNGLAALPTSAHPSAKAALAEIYNAEDKAHALAAVKAFEADFGAKITGDIDTAARALRVPRRAMGAPAHHRSSRPSPPCGYGPA
jgi:transposase-like protein